jgi:hypothetical protein
VPSRRRYDARLPGGCHEHRPRCRAGAVRSFSAFARERHLLRSECPVLELGRHVSAASATAWPSPGPRPGFGWGAARATTTLRRLIGSSVVVRPATMPRHHERPPRVAVSRRSGKSGPPRPAARLHPRVAAGSASPPPGRTGNPGQRTVCFCQFGLACLVSAGRRADAARLAHPPKEPLAPTSVGPWAAAAACREGAAKP